MSEPANLLDRERSPYLRQHAGNPVHWRAWGQAALDEARQSNKPILLSIGYAACHWCHVMAHESFENPDIASLMNVLYVNIKVDREERPDVDHLYMQALGEQGGWPLTMFLTPEAEPFWGGTYFPPEPRYGRPSFPQVLQAVARAWQAQDSAITTNVSGLQEALRLASATQPGDLPGEEVLQAASQRLLAMVDRQNGGLRGAPKFPNPPIFRLLWQLGLRLGNGEACEATRSLLRHMAQGGIYDHLAGGFARYSTDGVWLVPHFEKMLYDNAQLLELMALVHGRDPDPLLAERALGVVDWLETQMVSGGAYAASEDADSEGEEGRFYVWSEREIDSLLVPAFGTQACRLFKQAYDVSEGGNWEGSVILHRQSPRHDEAGERLLAQARALLLTARNRRPRPARDDKVLADWNALAVIGLCRAAAAFARPEWLALAERVWSALRHLLAGPDGRLQHAWCDGMVTAVGLLDDQAAAGLAALALFEATGEDSYLDEAVALAGSARRWFMDTDGSFFLTASDALDLPSVRPRSAGDGVTPSGNAMMAQLQARLFLLTGADHWREAAEATIRCFSGQREALAAMPGLLSALDLLRSGGCLVVGGGSVAERRAVAAQALAAGDPSLGVWIGRTAPGAGHPAAGSQARTTALPAGSVARRSAAYQLSDKTRSERRCARLFRLPERLPGQVLDMRWQSACDGRSAGARGGAQGAATIAAYADRTGHRLRGG